MSPFLPRGMHRRNRKISCKMLEDAFPVTFTMTVISSNYHCIFELCSKFFAVMPTFQFSNQMHQRGVKGRTDVTGQESKMDQKDTLRHLRALGSKRFDRLHAKWQTERQQKEGRKTTKAARHNPNFTRRSRLRLYVQKNRQAATGRLRRKPVTGVPLTSCYLL